jgi:hypothetical protein
MSVFYISSSKLRQPIAGTVPRGYGAPLGRKPEVRTCNDPHKARILGSPPLNARPARVWLVPAVLFGPCARACRARP